MKKDDNSIAIKDWLTLVAAVVAAVVSILNVTFNTWSQWQLENQKWVQTRQDDANRNLNLAVIDLTKKLAMGNQKIAWLIWKASNNSENFSLNDFADYNKEAKGLLPELTAGQITIAAMNQDMNNKLRPLVERWMELDGDVGRAEVIYLRDKEKGIATLLDLKQQMKDYQGKLESDVANIVSNKGL